MIIAAVRNYNDFNRALESKTKCIFLMFGDIKNIITMTEEAKKKNIIIFIHIELIKGLANDEYGVKYLYEDVKPFGIISTKKKIIEAARVYGLKSVLHFFVFDSKSCTKAMAMIEELKPDYVEIMPGVIPKIIKRVKMVGDIPVIVAGLIETQEECRLAISSGAYAIATSRQSLWR